MFDSCCRLHFPLALGHGAHYQQDEARRHGDGHFCFDGQVHNFPFNHGGNPVATVLIFPLQVGFEFQQGDGCQDGRLEVRSGKKVEGRIRN
jgi:hypothetical protein